MPLQFGALCDELSVVLGSGASSTDDIRTSFKRWLNQAFRVISYTYPWDGMRAEQRIATVAPYTTGTATFTQSSATVTGSGTTWTSAMIGRKIATAQGNAYYRVTAVGSTTSLTIADVFAETTASASAYTIFQDEYDLAATTHSIEHAVPIISTWHPGLAEYGQREIDNADIAGSSTGIPRAYAVCASTTVNTPRIRLLPVPDAIYRISIRYLKTWTDLSGDSDSYTTQGLPVDIEELAIDRALRWAPKIEGSRRMMTDPEWRAGLRAAWMSSRTSRYKTGTRGGISVRGNVHGLVAGTGGLV